MRRALLRDCRWENARMTARLTCERHTSDMTHTQTGIEERASARSNGSSAPTPPFALVIPGDPRIARVARALIKNPGSPRDLDSWAAWVDRGLKLDARPARETDPDSPARSHWL